MTEFHEALRALPIALRSILRPLLPDRAFLRRCRDDGLFITDAPARSGDPGLYARIESAGFLCRPEGRCLILSPDASCLTGTEEAFPEPPDFFCASVARLKGIPPSPEALALFARGIRLLESSVPEERRGFHQKTRELAAVSLRNRTGGAYACGLIDSVLNCEPD